MLRPLHRGSFGRRQSSLFPPQLLPLDQLRCGKQRVLCAATPEHRRHSAWREGTRFTRKLPATLRQEQPISKWSAWGGDFPGIRVANEGFGEYLHKELNAGMFCDIASAKIREI